MFHITVPTGLYGECHLSDEEIKAWRGSLLLPETTQLRIKSQDCLAKRLLGTERHAWPASLRSLQTVSASGAGDTVGLCDLQSMWLSDSP